jgi:uncharacterized protein
VKITFAVCVAAREVCEFEATAKAGETVEQLLVNCAIAERFGLNLLQIQLGVWGQRADLSQVLQDGDRVEIYRPLRVDPKVARRERFTAQGAKRAGLFKSRRLGGKAGY